MTLPYSVPNLSISVLEGEGVHRELSPPPDSALTRVTPMALCLFWVRMCWGQKEECGRGGAQGSQELGSALPIRSDRHIPNGYTS